MNQPLQVQPQGGTPDRHHTKDGIRCRIVEFVPTNAPTVYTAKLACGHRVRYDVHGPPGPPKKSKICPHCTKIKLAHTNDVVYS